MKTGGRVLWINLLISFASMGLLAQEPGQAILFSAGRFVTGNNIQQRQFEKQNLTLAKFGQQYFAVVQFSTLPGKAVTRNLEQAGIRLHTYLPGKAYVATIQANFNFGTAATFGIGSINAIPSFYKIGPGLLQPSASLNKTDVKRIAVTLYPTINRDVALQQFRAAGAVITPTKFDQDHLVFIEANLAIVPAVASMPFVSALRLQSLTDKPLNYSNVAANGVSGMSSPAGRNLNGRGVTVGIGDNADISTHIDFAGRLTNRSPYSPSFHGTHVAGSAAGSGIINVKNRGMAPRANLVNQAFSNIVSFAPAYVTDQNMVLTNNSYHLSDEGCAGEGEYDVYSEYIDEQMGRYGQLLHVIAAGNDGGLNCAGYPAGYATIKSGWQTAKNVLTVGALNSANYTIAGFSSRGPLKDGRIKPELVTGGVGVISTAMFDAYGSNTGTSMAAPTATGALSLLYERYRQMHLGADPSAALIKVLACNTAEDLGNAGPDYTYGFGMLNVRRAMEAMESNRYIINSVSPGVTNTNVITVPANTRRLKVMLYWADTAAANNAAKALVNDLDLTVTTPAAVAHQPLVLNASMAGVNNTAIEGVDRVNNIEQVVIENPVAGDYNIRVNGFEVPFGSQQYVITYEIVQPSVTVEYPAGGEKWVPGETEAIRWSAYGMEANNFTLEYSTDNGSNWTLIDGNVAAGIRKYSWVVPAGVSTAQALVRVGRNGSSYTDRSDAVFTLMGSPVLSVSNACEGAVQLNWNSVADATSYDILQLHGDTMRVVANTANQSFVLAGLDKKAKAWFGVAARSGSTVGRRSLSVSATPNSGACTLAAFNNDLSVDSILEPTTARQGFANAGNAIKPVKILIKNAGTVPVNGAINVSFSYGAAIITETINASIAAGGTYTHTFTGMYPVLATGFKYPFKSWVSLSTDGNHLNDTAYKIVRSINNDVITSLPVTEGFESFGAVEFTQDEMAIGDRDRIDFSGSSTRKRARTFVNSGFAYSGNRSITLDQTPYNSVSTTDSLTISYNLTNYQSNQLRVDFFYRNHGQKDAPGNKVWIRGSEHDNWIQAYDLYANQSALGTWKRALININDVLAHATPAQVPTQTFQLKIGQEGFTAATVATAPVDMDDGYTFDDLTLSEVLNDVSLARITAPDLSGCSLGEASQVSVRVKNYNNTALNNLQVSYQVNGAAIVTENLASIGANQEVDFVFAQTANLSGFIDHQVKAWVSYPGDNYPVNDSIVDFTVHNSPLVSSFPYLQNFDAGDGDFYTRGFNSSWQWGTPAKPVINKAASGGSAWITSLAGNYNNAEASYLISPCFDIRQLAQPVLSFSHVLITEQNYDYSWVEYSTDGATWQKLGNVGGGTNWYDQPSLMNWSASNPKWHVSSYDLPVSATTIRFRFVMNSDAGVTDEGIGIDDIHVFDKATIYDGSPLTNITQQVGGNGWVHFSSGGNRVASVNANGANLGATTVSVYPYTGSMRNSNDQYYANRNIVLHSGIPPTGNVNVRFYFTAAEAQNLVAANGCTTCPNVTDPYELGITQYTGTATDENGLVTDDLTGYFRYILPANTVVVPYDNGYYAEFSVKSFGEFWLSPGNIKPTANGVCAGDIVRFKAAATGSSYQWQENDGSGFKAISDGARYAGTNSATLQLMNLPNAYADYQYRCLVNGVPGIEQRVRLTAIWNGATSNDWSVGTNWSCGVVPDQYTDVIVPGGLVLYPVVNSSSMVRSISVQPGAIVTVAAAANLQVTGK